MPKERRGSKAHEDLALAVARGIPLARWAKENGVAERTCRDWAAKPEFKAMVEIYRRRIVDRLVGQIVDGSTKAVRRLNRLMDDPSPTVRLSAARAILDRVIPVVEYADIERRIAKLEETAREQF